MCADNGLVLEFLAPTRETATLELGVSSVPLGQLSNEVCAMQLQVLNRTNSGGFKFKVRHLTVASGPTLQRRQVARRRAPFSR